MKVARRGSNDPRAKILKQEATEGAEERCCFACLRSLRCLLFKKSEENRRPEEGSENTRSCNQRHKQVMSNHYSTYFKRNLPEKKRRLLAVEHHVIFSFRSAF